MKLKEKQELANKLSNLHNYTLNELVNLVNIGKAPKYLLTDTGKVSITGVKKFVDKYGLNKNITVKVEPTIVENYNEYVLLIDNSGSTSRIDKQIENGVNSFVTNLAKQDNNAMVNLVRFREGTFNQTGLTNIFKLINSYIHKASGGTPLTKTLEHYLKQGKTNTTIVVFTDGECDRGSYGAEDIQSLVSNYKGTIVFIGTGEHYAKIAGIKDGNILTFEASISGTIEAYEELIEASIEHTRGIKAGKDMSKEDFFKTKTELATMLKKSANIDMAVCYEKKMSKEQKESNIKEAQVYMNSILQGYACDVKPDYNKLFNIMNKVEERILVGKHDGTINEFGRYKFIEYNSKTQKNPYREVNPDTILWIEIKGKRYNKK